MLWRPASAGRGPRKEFPLTGLLGIFGSKSAALRPEVRQAIQERHSLSNAALDGLRVVEKRGKFAGRPVIYFRIFQTSAASVGDRLVRSYGDLDHSANLVTYEGHEEMDTQLVSLKGPDRHAVQP